jgi:hypothetical protein
MVSSLTPGLILGIVLVYFMMLIGISLITGKRPTVLLFSLPAGMPPGYW